MPERLRPATPCRARHATSRRSAFARMSAADEDAVVGPMPVFVR